LAFVKARIQNNDAHLPRLRNSALVAMQKPQV
jgi:hypothetical protein